MSRTYEFAIAGNQSTPWRSGSYCGQGIQGIISATPEQVGVALVLHMQTEGNRFSPHIFQGNINNWYGNQGSPSWLMQRVSEGMQWALQLLLVVPDLSQMAGAWYVLSREPARSSIQVATLSA